MKRLFILASALLSTTFFAQLTPSFGFIGINTQAPKATLDIQGAPDNTTRMDGLIAPRLTGNQLDAKTYTTEQTGAIVYVTAAPTTHNNTQTASVNNPDYYFFDGTKWNKVLNNNQNLYFPLAGNTPSTPVTGTMFVDNWATGGKWYITGVGRPGLNSNPQIEFWDDGEVAININNTSSNVLIKNIEFDGETIRSDRYYDLDAVTPNPSGIQDGDYVYVQKKYVDIRVPKPPTSGTYILQSVDGVTQWVPQ